MDNKGASQVVLVVKNLSDNAGDVKDTGSVPRWGRSPGGEHANPLQYSCLENPMDGGAWWAAVHGVARSWTRLSNFIFTFHFRALEKAMAAHSSVLAWRIPGTGEPGGLSSMGSHRVGHDWSDLAAHMHRKNWPLKKMFSFISVQFALLNNKGSWDSNLLPRVPTCDQAVREGTLLLKWQPWGETNRESGALRSRMGWRASEEHFPQRHWGWPWGRRCPLTMQCLGESWDPPYVHFPLLSVEQTAPSAGPTGVVHLAVYHLHIHP